MTEPHDESKFQADCARIVHNEVYVTLSNLVHTLAQGYGADPRRMTPEVNELMEQAYELARPIEDWESAAREEGWELASNDDAALRNDELDRDWPEVDWEAAARDAGIEEPHEREVYEHWSVSNWLADKLEEQGEKIDRDFASHNVWARTTTGQAISMDYVIRVIVKGMNRVLDDRDAELRSSYADPEGLTE